MKILKNILKALLRPFVRPLLERIRLLFREELEPLRGEKASEAVAALSAQLTHFKALSRARDIKTLALVEEKHGDAINSMQRANLEFIKAVYSLPEHIATVLDVKERAFLSLYSLPGYLSFQHDDRCRDLARDLMRLVAPHDAHGMHKVRMGGLHDGGYVMLDPGMEGIAYSFGISDQSPWDLAMAERGFTVYQYDGTIEAPPDAHPRLIFRKYNIVSAKHISPLTRNLAQIIKENGHEDENALILQMDIEGAEWEVFEDMDESQIRKFKQIIVEFHGLDVSEPAEFSRRLRILETICITHQPVHIHFNNWGRAAYFDDFSILAEVMEITFARRKDFTFSKSTVCYPTALDMPNCACLPDMAVPLPWMTESSVCGGGESPIFQDRYNKCSAHILQK